MTDLANSRPRRASLPRSALLAIGLAAGLVAFGAFVFMFPPACFIGGRPPDPPAPWYAIFLARPILVVGPAAFLIAGSFVGLGSERVGSRLFGVAMAIVAAVVAFMLATTAMNSCA